MKTEAGRQRQLAALVRARAASLEARRHPSSVTDVKRVLRGPKRLRARHLDIARRVVLGQSQRDIARELGMDSTFISVICQSPVFQQHLQSLQSTVDSHFVKKAALDPVREKMQAESLTSVGTLVELRDSALKEDVRFKSAMGILECAGYRQLAEKDSGHQPLDGGVAESIRVGLKEVIAYIEVKRSQVPVSAP